MLVPVNDLSRHARLVAPRLLAIADTVLASGHFVLGPAVAGFEAAFADYCGAPHCVGVANGTDALELSLRALGVGPGDTVIVAANAAMYGTSAVIATGATAAFAEIDPATGLLDAVGIRDAQERCGGARAVIVTHLYGRLAEMEPILELCRQHGIALIEDCAQAHGARSSTGRRAGSFGDLATFSFYPTKNLGAVGDGGAVVSTRDDLAARVRQLRQYGWSSKYVNSLPGGRNSRLDELQAAFLLAMLPDLDERNAHRRRIANRYSNEVTHGAIQVPAPGGDEYVAHLYVVRTAARDSLSAHLKANGIGCEVHYPIPDYRQPVLASRYAEVDLYETQAWCDTVLTLPCFPEMTASEVDRVVAACNAWEEGR